MAPGQPAEGNLIKVQVGHVEYLGDQSIAYASMEGEPALIAVRQHADGEPLRSGDQLRVHLPARHCNLFDALGAAFLHSVTIERGKHGG